MMSAQLILWEPSTVAAPPRRRWIPRCDDCGRRIWAREALTRRFGRLLGGRCHRRRVRAARRLTIRIRIADPGHIPGQLTIGPTEHS
jgi:hypothetical protein